MSKYTKHLPHYIPIIAILSVGMFAFFQFSYDRDFQIGVSMAMGVSYFSWGVIHHLLHNDLTFEVFMEYLFISIFGIVTLIGLIAST